MGFLTSLGCSVKLDSHELEPSLVESHTEISSALSSLSWLQREFEIIVQWNMQVKTFGHVSIGSFSTCSLKCHVWQTQIGTSVMHTAVAVVCTIMINLDPFCAPQSIHFEIFGPPRPLYFRNNIIWTPMHVINYSTDSQGSGAGFWVLMVSRVSL